jgi:predicted  nucleic acid-binding Zn-ribbon protein
LEASRDPVVKSVPHDLLAANRRIRRKIETGPAVVPVSPGGDTCTGCHMTLRAQVANEVLAGKMHACSNCGRLVYNPESFSSSETVVEAGG